MSSTFLTVLNLVAAILSSGFIQSLVQAIELIFKNASGDEKKQAALRCVYGLVPAVAVPILSRAIDVEVFAFNEAGVFVHQGVGGGNEVGSGGSGSASGAFGR